MMVQSARSNISGNMLIYILGAIFLMGLLIVLLKGSFQEGTGIDSEKVMLQVGEIQRYGAEMERGVRYILNDGYSESDLRFASLNTTSYGSITDIPARQVFSPEGGGVEWKAPPADSQVATTEWIFSGANEIPQIGSTCGAASCSDLLMILPDVTKAFCLQVNRNQSILPSDGEPPPADNAIDIATYFTIGAFSYADTLETFEDVTDGKSEGCFAMSGKYYYYRVLLAR